MATKVLKAVVPQAGRPLYLSARDAVREAIDRGVFAPGEQMPSTKELSQQLDVSLVTAHRALQELVATGVLQRSQGKGTFVHHRYHDRKSTICHTRIGLFFHGEASLADFYHGQILDGVRQGAQQHNIDLVLLRFGEDIRNECNGFLYVNPLPDEMDALAAETRRRQPILSVGANPRSGRSSRRISSLDVDNVELARQAVVHLTGLGHTNIAYVGTVEPLSNSLDRWQGFRAACEERGLIIGQQNVVKGASWRLDEVEKTSLIHALAAPNRPSAVFAAGYYFALDVYSAAQTVGLRVPEDLSIVGVDDPPSAAHLSPPLTTMRQPLVQLGREAVTMLFEQINDPTRDDVVSRSLWAELVIRRSSAPAGR
jgi:LacI family transcriptional regulator